MVATDVLVIGAGIAGAATAYHLSKAGMSVCLVEARQPAWGASGRNPGFLWLQTKPKGLSMEFSLAGRGFAEELSANLFCYATDFTQSIFRLLCRTLIFTPTTHLDWKGKLYRLHGGETFRGLTSFRSR